MKTIRKILSLFSKEEKRQLYYLLPAVIVMALVEVIGIASIIPFLDLLSQPEARTENPLLNSLYTKLGFASDERFLIFVGLGVLAILLLSNAFTMVVTWAILRFTWMRNYTISRRLLASYLYRPYAFFLNRNTAELSASLFSEVQQIILYLILPGMRMVARFVVAVFILTFLFIYDPLLALITFALLGSTYGAIFFVVKRNLSNLGVRRVAAQRRSYKFADEALSGIKEIKLLGKEESFIERFSLPAEDYARSTATSQIIAHIPRYALEVIAFGGILTVVLYYLIAKGDVANVLPMLGLYAFASYRLLPALQSIFEALTKVQVNAAMLENLSNDLQKANAVSGVERSESSLSFRDRLEFRYISYTYPETQHPVIHDLNLVIEAGSTVAFVGTTGSGKTTTVDLLLGLLSSSTGELRLDGVLLDEDTLPSWQRKLGYVPQTIYLSDDSVLNNIALGVATEYIDKAAVVKAAKAADIHEFIETMPNGYETEVGERGIRLSGGQRQRLGIARALYHDPEVLILDEATSALDNLTEETVFKAIEAYSGRKTLIMIAHRLSTVKNCDTIFLLDKGRLIAQGSYDELVITSKQFAAMVRSVKGNPHRQVVESLRVES